jgi:nucleoside-diphosphate-sugar epimerase
MNEVTEKVRRLVGPLEVVRLPTQRGDVRHTAADTSQARQAFGYEPAVSLDEGLERMVEAVRTRWDLGAAAVTGA